MSQPVGDALMEYAYFHNQFEEYARMRNLGLKKQANAVLDELAEQLRALHSDAERDALLLPFCQEVCSSETLREELLGGRHRLPFQLESLAEESMRRKCDQGEMPWLRWYYELFRYRPDTPAYAMLARALDSPSCDQRTVDLRFDNLIEDLWYGNHHFPEGCTLSTQEYHELVAEGNEMLRKNSVDEKRRSAFSYHKALYDCWDAWKAAERPGDFGEFCEQRGVEFRPVGAYYY